MVLELASRETELIRELLVQDLEETRVEERRAVNAEYKTRLQAREHLEQELLGRMAQAC
jgi:hypothetical protein